MNLQEIRKQKINMKLFLASRINVTLSLISPLLSVDPSQLKVVFIPTAADPYEDKPWVGEERAAFVDRGFDVTDYDLKSKDNDRHLHDLEPYDIVHVSGGNTFYLLDIVRKTGFDSAIRRLLDNGKIYCGSSAGSIIMCPTIAHVESVEHKDMSPSMSNLDGLNLVSALLVPHYGREKYATRHEMIRKQWGNGVTFLRDDQAIIVNGNKKTIVTLQK